MEAAKDSVGQILLINSIEGMEIQTNNIVMNSAKTGKDVAVWKAAIEELQSSKLATSVSDKNEIFQLTKLGYDVSEELWHNIFLAKWKLKLFGECGILYALSNMWDANRSGDYEMSESQNIEWKESWCDEYLKWVCGFANAQGGKIYTGTWDDGMVIRISNSKKLLKDISNRIQNKLGIMADVNLLTKGDRIILR